MTTLVNAIQTLRRIEPREICGRVKSIRGLTAMVQGLAMPVGGLVRIEPRLAGSELTYGEIVGCDERGAIIMLFSASRGLSPGDRVVGLQAAPTVGLGLAMLGRVIDGLGRPIDNAGPLRETAPRLISPEPLSALDRAAIRQPVVTGVRVLDTMLTAGKGQRLGIFAGPGVGKSTLLGSIARNTKADATVIGLIGERGREVRDFLEHSLGPEGLARSVVVVSTSDESPLMRIRAAFVAMAAAEYLRDQGMDVLLLMDSITRFCQAQRQIGLAVGEPPATKGYTPSVFAMLASLLERAGAVTGRGSVTGYYTVLVEGDDMTEPVSDAARGILDGHIALARKLANQGHYPAIDVLDSVSRVANDVSAPEHATARRQITRTLADYAAVEDLVTIGAYVTGSNPNYDVAIEFKPRIDQLLTQPPDEASDFSASVKALVNLAIEIGHARAAAGRR